MVRIDSARLSEYTGDNWSRRKTVYAHSIRAKFYRSALREVNDRGFSRGIRGRDVASSSSVHARCVDNAARLLADHDRRGVLLCEQYTSYMDSHRGV
jgi:hypothetical protein